VVATAAIVVGILAITGVLPGFDTNTNHVKGCTTGYRAGSAD
jgi:hypothetical protein